MNTTFISINIFGDDLEVKVSYEEFKADPEVGLEKELCVTAVELQRVEKWDGEGNPANTIHSVDLLPFLSEWAIRDVLEAVMIRNLELAAQERRNARLSRRAA